MTRTRALSLSWRCARRARTDRSAGVRRALAAPVINRASEREERAQATAVRQPLVRPENQAAVEHLQDLLLGEVIVERKGRLATR